MALAETEVAPHVLTYEQYLAEFWTEPVSTQRYDIIKGVRVLMTSPNWWHQQIAFALGLVFARYKKEHGGQFALAPLDVVVDPQTLQVRQPDVFFISDARLAEAGGIPDNGPLPLAPELVVEVLSPTETPRILRDKIADFCAAGVQECWVVSPNAESVELLRLTPDGPERIGIHGVGETVTSLAFPEMTVAVADVFDV